MDYICNTADLLELGCLTEFQGGLKQRTADDIEKIKKSIRRRETLTGEKVELLERVE